MSLMDLERKKKWHCLVIESTLLAFSLPWYSLGWLCTPPMKKGGVHLSVLICINLALVKASLVAQMVKNLPAMQETQDPSVGRKDPLEKEMATHSSIFAGIILWTEATVHGVAKSPTGVVSHFNLLDLLFSHQVVLDFFETPWTIAHQAPLSIGFPRQKY